VEQFASFDWMSTVDAKHPIEQPPDVPQKSQSRRNKKARKVMGIEDSSTQEDTNKSGNQDRPVQMSKTQKEKDRKKRGKAKIVIEHVDIIGDKFWERRPWILSGRAG
jgi:tRNA(His) guanylyltransferase